MLRSIGRTPLIRLKEIERHFSLKGRIFAKAELLNPGGSIKDRAALAMIEDAEKRGIISHGSLLCEPTSGNTGIALAMIGAARGYRVKIVMPEGASVEREALMRAYGATVIRVGGGMKQAIEMAKEIVKNENAYMPNQFENTACIDCHYRQTAPEVWGDLAADISTFIAGVGTGATLIGVGRFLKERCSARIIAVEPTESAVLGGGCPSLHGIEGIGAGFVPKLYDAAVVNEVKCVSYEEAVEMTRLLAKKEGILAGISSGANLCSAVRRGLAAEGNIVIPLCDRGERYFSKGIF